MPTLKLDELELDDETLELIATCNADVPLEKFIAVLIQLGSPKAREIISQFREHEKQEALENQTKH